MSKSPAVDVPATSLKYGESTGDDGSSTVRHANFMKFGSGGKAWQSQHGSLKTLSLEEEPDFGQSALTYQAFSTVAVCLSIHASYLPES